jgi:Uma2 family endonuclease
MYKIQENGKNMWLVQEPIEQLNYTYADYLRWTIEERVELIKGQILKLSAPNRMHQSVSGNLYYAIRKYLNSQPCKVFAAPFDVRLPTKKNGNKDTKISTVVQPDISVICNAEKLDEKGCIGAPDLVIEILSPGNSTKEVKLKYGIYEEAGVKEYWIVQPDYQNIITYTLNKSTQKFEGGKINVVNDTINSYAIEGLLVKVTDVFDNL